jgi:hypothetical protein
MPPMSGAARERGKAGRYDGAAQNHSADGCLPVVRTPVSAPPVEHGEFLSVRAAPVARALNGGAFGDADGGGGAALTRSKLGRGWR